MGPPQRASQQAAPKVVARFELLTLLEEEKGSRNRAGGLHHDESVSDGSYDGTGRMQIKHKHGALLKTVTEMQSRLRYIASSISDDDSELAQLLLSSAESIERVVERLELRAVPDKT